MNANKWTPSAEISWYLEDVRVYGYDRSTVAGDNKYEVVLSDRWTGISNSQ